MARQSSHNHQQASAATVIASEGKPSRLFCRGAVRRRKVTQWLLKLNVRNRKCKTKRQRRQMKKLVVFDLDGMLEASKSSLEAEMALLLRELLEVLDVASISGGAWLQFERQVLSNLPQNTLLGKLSILPTCGRSSIQKISPKMRLRRSLPR
jgi:hypothetical protein